MDRQKALEEKERQRQENERKRDEDDPDKSRFLFFLAKLFHSLFYSNLRLILEN